MVSWVVPLASFVDAAVSDEERGIIVTDEFTDLVLELGVDVFHFTVFVNEELLPVRIHVVLVVWTVPLDKLLISVDAGLASLSVSVLVDFELVEDMLVELLDVEVVLVDVDAVLVLVVLVDVDTVLVLVVLVDEVLELVVLVDVVLVLEVLVDVVLELVVLVDVVLVLEVLVDVVLEFVVLVDVVLVLVVLVDVVLVLLVLVDLFFVLANSKACAGLLNCSSPLPATRVPAIVLQAPPSTGQSCTRVLNILLSRTHRSL